MSEAEVFARGGIKDVLVSNQVRDPAKIDRLARMRQAGVTMVLVSHDLDLIETFADRAIYLGAGRIRAEGRVQDVVERYRADVAGRTTRSSEDTATDVRVIEEGRRWGSGEVEIRSVELVTDAGPTRLIPTDSPLPCRHTSLMISRRVGAARPGISITPGTGATSAPSALPGGAGPSGARCTSTPR